MSEKTECIGLTKNGQGPKCTKKAMTGKKCCTQHKSQEPGDNQVAKPNSNNDNGEINTKNNTKNNTNTTTNTTTNATNTTITIPVANKETQDLCHARKGKDNAVCGTRAMYQCTDCTKCESVAFCLRCWKKTHGVKTTRSIPDDDNRCEHKNASGAKERCKFKSTGLDDGVKSCAKHGGPSAGGVLKPRAKGVNNMDIPYSEIWSLRLEAGETIKYCKSEICAQSGCGDNNAESLCFKRKEALEWLDDYIDMTSKGSSQQQVLNHFAILADKVELNIVQTLVNDFKEQNMKWLFASLNKFSTIIDTVNKDKIDTVWKSIAQEYKLAITAPKSEPKAKNSIESPSISNGRNVGNMLLKKFKITKKTENDNVEKLTE